jgi:hypothetical protein
MQLTDPNNPNERKKLIAAGVLGVVAILVLGYIFFGGTSSKPTPNRNARAIATPTPARIIGIPAETAADDPASYQPINYNPYVPAITDASRNIFAYYEPPPPPVKVVIPPTPTPTPVPPLLLSSLGPSNVYARTADFSLQVGGDKFTPAVHIVIDGRDLPTRFINAQQLFTTVPAALIANPGPRQALFEYGNAERRAATAPELQLYRNYR